MKISSKGRNAISIMVYLGKHFNENRYISLKEISENEDISLKYLEKIMIDLNNDDYLDVKKGNSGGYRLKGSLKDYKIGDILRKSEGVDLSCDDKNCEKKDICPSYPIYKELNDEFSKIMDNKTLEDYM